MQWPGSYCDTRQSCCYPETGKPDEDFGIHGLWPNYNDGTYPSSCDRSNSFDESKISDLLSRLEKDWPTLACPSGDGIKFWGHEWRIRPADGKYHSLESIKEAIEQALGVTTIFIDCNVDTRGNHQIYQVYLCVDTSASNFIECPVLPHGRPCGNKIEFPSFSSDSNHDEL
ncbi:hypothetical protein RHGRI_033960 [Rhododendron griersonianum]|uniref:Uncharacterized protein n=1 Tax=Rhododendron griersonianum TaxID=479676 RepID=A0AAV6HYT8_9ERIC|nr:hypothetical protein RHGRI_033960 [Rhododendron griersonianum]